MVDEYVLHTGRWAEGWRWHASGAVEADRQVPIAGGLAATAVFALWEQVGRRRHRAGLARLEAPGWRYLGRLWVVLTDRRLAVWRDGTWSSVWFDDRTRVDDQPGGELVMRFPTSEPYLLRWAS